MNYALNLVVAEAVLAPQVVGEVLVVEVIEVLAVLGVLNGRSKNTFTWICSTSAARF